MDSIECNLIIKSIDDCIARTGNDKEAIVSHLAEKMSITYHYFAKKLKEEVAFTEKDYLTIQDLLNKNIISQRITIKRGLESLMYDIEGLKLYDLCNVIAEDQALEKRNLDKIDVWNYIRGTKGPDKNLKLIKKIVQDIVDDRSLISWEKLNHVPYGVVEPILERLKEDYPSIIPSAFYSLIGKVTGLRRDSVKRKIRKKSTWSREQVKDILSYNSKTDVAKLDQRVDLAKYEIEFNQFRKELSSILGFQIPSSWIEKTIEHKTNLKHAPIDKIKKRWKTVPLSFFTEISNLTEIEEPFLTSWSEYVGFVDDLRVSKRVQIAKVPKSIATLMLTEYSFANKMDYNWLLGLITKNVFGGSKVFKDTLLYKSTNLITLDMLDKVVDYLREERPKSVETHAKSEFIEFVDGYASMMGVRGKSSIVNMMREKGHTQFDKRQVQPNSGYKHVSEDHFTFIRDSFPDPYVRDDVILKYLKHGEDERKFEDLLANVKIDYKISEMDITRLFDKMHNSCNNSITEPANRDEAYNLLYRMHFRLLEFNEINLIFPFTSYMCKDEFYAVCFKNGHMPRQGEVVFKDRLIKLKEVNETSNSVQYVYAHEDGTLKFETKYQLN